MIKIREMFSAIISFVSHFLFLLFGIVFCVFSIYSIVDLIIFRINAEPVSCKIIEISEDRNSDNEICYDLYVSYSYNGLDYDRVRIDDWNNLVQVDSNVSVYCNSNNPEDLRAYKPSIFAIIVNFVPFLFGLIAIFIGVTPIFSRYEKMKLLRTGKVIYAEIESIEEIRRRKRYGNNIYKINCYYYDEFSGKGYRFTEMIFDKSQYEKLHEQDTIKIVVKPEDYNYYIIDL